MSGKISPGDYLLAVDGRGVSSMEYAKRLLVGARGSEVTMTFERNDHRLHARVPSPNTYTFAYDVTVIRDQVYPTHSFELADQALLSSKDETAYNRSGIPMFCQKDWAEPDDPWRAKGLNSSSVLTARETLVEGKGTRPLRSAGVVGGFEPSYRSRVVGGGGEGARHSAYGMLEC